MPMRPSAIALWDSARGERVLGAAVLLVVAAAIGYVARRLWSARRDRRR
jgi:hypothetical protein